MIADEESNVVQTRGLMLEQYFTMMGAELDGLPGRVLAKRVARDCGIELSPSEARVELERVALGLRSGGR